MCYCKRKRCGWNNNHTSGFNAEWQRERSVFRIMVDHDYWKLSGTAPRQETPVRLSVGGGTQGRLASQNVLDISELFQRRQVESYIYNFTSFLFV